MLDWSGQNIKIIKNHWISNYMILIKIEALIKVIIIIIKSRNKTVIMNLSAMSLSIFWIFIKKRLNIKNSQRPTFYLGISKTSLKQTSHFHLKPNNFHFIQETKPLNHLPVKDNNTYNSAKKVFLINILINSIRLVLNIKNINIIIII